MNNDFPRMMSLLRKEKKLSQKQVSKDLGVAQALLSHYEKGKRECGLDFLIRASDYYNVSADFLLGRSASRNGSLIFDMDTESSPDTKQSVREAGSLSIALSKKLIVGGIDVVFSLMSRVKNQKLTQNISNMLLLSIYRVFRLIHKTNPANPPDIFGLDNEIGFRAASAYTDIYEGKAISCALEKGKSQVIEITTASLEREYQKQGAALLNLVKNCEAIIKL
ncbi:MAG: helix-turn-helix transcriptional regulator [Eubacterium sp.]|jgi:transcriptional regulator with XRE-family HTH domain|nr:helix-turn-helix transcriptional regulator [Eubacterium sp.]